MFDLSGKIALITGGSRGIGFGIAQGYARAGATVVIANRRPETGAEAVKRLGREGLQAVAVPVDIRSVSSIAEMAARVIGEFGGVDVLVNDAGITLRRPAEETTEADWDDVVDTNLKGCFFCCQAIGREMIRRQHGKIINVSSVHSNMVLPDMSVYAATKAGISHLTRALALEWGKHNVTVNCIGPGATMTDMNKPTWDAHPEYLRDRIGSLPLGRIAYPQDYVGAAVFLASAASDYVTGVTLHVDGGLLLGRK